MTKSECKKIAKQYDVPWTYVEDVIQDMEGDGIKVDWQDIADMIVNDDIW